TAAKDGIYLVSTSIYFKENVTGDKRIEVWIYKNGAAYTVAGQSPGETATIGSSISARIPLVATDTIYIRAYQSLAEGRQLDKRYCRFSIAKIA
ncbi:unnamed protein product, partial [marine sediment metagenome]